MKKLLATAIMSVLLTGAAFAQMGDAKIERFRGEKITGVNASYTFDITVKQGASTGAVVMIPDHMKDKLVLELKNGIVTLGMKDMDRKKSHDERYQVEIICSTLEYVELSGLVNMEIEGKLNTPKMDIRLSGVTKIENETPVNISTTLTARMSGVSKIDMNATVGSTARLEVSGTSRVNLTGTAQTLFVEASGVSNIVTDDFKVRDATASASGASKIDLYASQTIKATASGASTIRHAGNARVTSSNTSGASSIIAK